MGAVAVVGAQWGDEGKGKVVDLYASDANMVVRYGGGANAGHTLVVGGEKLVFHLMPSGALHKGAHSVLGHGTVIDPAVLLAEIDALNERGLFEASRLTISDRAHVVLPHHVLIDSLRDGRSGSLGTTKRGIGPTYEDKAARRGVRMGDLLDENKLQAKLTAAVAAWSPTIEAMGGRTPELEQIVQLYLDYGQRLAPSIRDASEVVDEALKAGKRVLLEGAQGALLDVDAGTYPFVTSSSTIAGGACTGVGIGPTQISAVVGITKAYTTRVGNGPFPTELQDKMGDALREAGSEFGATTGRPRRCGWLDLPALRYAVRVNGLSGIALTKIDVLTGLQGLKLCTGYQLNGKVLRSPPYDDLEHLTPIFEDVEGWSEPLSDCRDIKDLPEAAQSYIKRIEREVDCPIVLVSVGPDREQTIVLKPAFAG